MVVSTLAMFYIERVAMDNGSNGFGWNERQKVVTIMDLTETSDEATTLMDLVKSSQQKK